MTTISFILPVFNVEKYLEKCLLSIKPFLIKGHQLILVNDGSTDKSLNILNDFHEENSNYNVTIINKLNGGLSDARNVGLSKATGDYIWFIDTDDWLDSSAIEILESNILNNNYDLIILGRKEIFSHKIRKIPAKLSIKNYQNGIEYFNDAIFQHNFRTQVWDKIFRTQFIKDHQLTFVKGLLYEDMLFMLQTVLHAQKVLVYPLYAYCYNQTNITSISKRIRKKDLDILRFIELSDEYIKKAGKSINELSLSYNLLIFNWVSTCLLNKYVQLSLKNSEALYIYNNAINHPIYRRAIQICIKGNVGLRRKIFAWLLLNHPIIYKYVLILAVQIKSIL